MREVRFKKNAFNDFCEIASLDKKLFKKLEKLIAESTRTPYKGTGKPEKLKHSEQDVWSRRIDQKHRLVYAVFEDHITVLKCKGHYDDK